MFQLITECHEFLKDSGLTYAFCGGYALDLFLNKTVRPHADIDISVFDKDRKKIVAFMLRQRWDVYEHNLNWSGNKIANAHLRPILTANDDYRLNELKEIWTER